MEAATAVKEGLTTSRAPFIEKAKQQGQLYIEQPYELYSQENHEAWRRLFAAQQPLWEKYANDYFQRGVANLALPHDRVPKLVEVNKFLSPLTGFKAKPVSGY